MYAYLYAAFTVNKIFRLPSYLAMSEHDRFYIFKPGVHTWFLEITFVHECMRVCICVYAPEAINN